MMRDRLRRTITVVAVVAAGAALAGLVTATSAAGASTPGIGSPPLTDRKPAPPGTTHQALAKATISVTITVSAHRGGAQEEPQNSLVAFQDALDENIAEVEADTWITADDVVVVEHDEQLTAPRCTGPYLDQNIEDMTWDQVQQMQCDGEPIPTEGQLLQLMSDSTNTTTRLRLESKAYSGESPDRIRQNAHEVGAAVVTAGLTRRAVMEDFSWDGIAGFHDASAALRVSALITRPTDAAARQAKELGAYDLSYDADYSTPLMNAYISSLGLVPTVWNVDAVPVDPGPLSDTQQHVVVASARRAVSSGARVVIVNNPQLVETALTQPSNCGLAWHDVTDHVVTPTSHAANRAYYHTSAALPTYEVVQLRIVQSRYATETAQLTPEGSPSHSTSLHLLRNRSQTVQVPLMEYNGVRVATTYTTSGATVTVLGSYQRTCA